MGSRYGTLATNHDLQSQLVFSLPDHTKMVVREHCYFKFVPPYLWLQQEMAYVMHVRMNESH